jgi:hypothetical protein
MILEATLGAGSEMIIDVAPGEGGIGARGSGTWEVRAALAVSWPAAWGGRLLQRPLGGGCSTAQAPRTRLRCGP